MNGINQEALKPLARKYEAVKTVLGPDLMCDLLGISRSSLSRYASAKQPALVAARLGFLAEVISDLSGAYNQTGIRRWFSRPRHLLDGKSPKELLRARWKPEDTGPRQVLDLARALRCLPST